MFENFSYKQKLIGLGIIILLLFFTANKRSFKVTKDAYKQMKDLESRLAYMKTSSVGSEQLQDQMQIYDKLLGQTDIEANQVQQEILDFATRYSIVRIDQLKEIHFSSANGFNIITNQLVLEGDFSSLLEVTYEFEKSFKASSLVSANFLKTKDFKKRVNKLKVELIFQNYEKSI